MPWENLQEEIAEIFDLESDKPRPEIGHNPTKKRQTISRREANKYFTKDLAVQAIVYDQLRKNGLR